MQRNIKQCRLGQNRPFGLLCPNHLICRKTTALRLLSSTIVLFQPIYFFSLSFSSFYLFYLFIFFRHSSEPLSLSSLTSLTSSLFSAASGFLTSTRCSSFSSNASVLSDDLKKTVTVCKSIFISKSIL